MRTSIEIGFVITHWEKLLDSDWLRDCEFICNLRANSDYRSQGQILYFILNAKTKKN